MSSPGVFFFLLTVFISVLSIRPGPLYNATEGEPWPKVNLRQDQPTPSLLIQLQTFGFNVVGKNCKILQGALNRYQKILLNDAKWRPEKKARRGNEWADDISFQKENIGGILTELNIDLREKCEDYPYLHMDESYTIRITVGESGPEAELASDSIWGILRGLETFSQLTYRAQKYNQLLIKCTYIEDEPRFPHRGLMLDTGRHYLPKKTILKVIDGLECNKMNVFHWHLVDDQSFPYQSKKFPSLSEKGAYHPEAYIYTQQDVKDIIEYARVRGIRVIPEFDSPGHTRSWGEGIPNLLTQCYRDGKLSGELGPIDPSQLENYQFLQDFFSEISGLFKDKYVHIGGDEVDPTCWESNPYITDFMKKLGIPGDYSKLEGLYIAKLLNIMSGLNLRSTVWQEVFEHGAALSNETVVHIWTGPQNILLYNVTKSGYQAILSTCWYLDHVAPDIYGGGGDWKLFYDCEPLDFIGSPEQKKLVIGGEACMWGEYVDATNLVQRVWPRASAAAEKLWSDINALNLDHDEAAHRLEEHTCRMRRRGIHAQPPNGPGACL